MAEGRTKALAVRGDGSLWEGGGPYVLTFLPVPSPLRSSPPLTFQHSLPPRPEGGHHTGPSVSFDRTPQSQGGPVDPLFGRPKDRGPLASQTHSPTRPAKVCLSAPVNLASTGHH